MTELLYLEDSYLREIDAAVIDADENGVVLNRTVFYPGGGGQPSDKGHILVDGKSIPVVKMQRRDGRMWHILEGEIPEVGTDVHGVLDWERRYSLMRTHTAMHILCGVIWRDYGASVTGGNMQPLRGRMDFEFEHMQKELVHEIEEKVNIEVEAARDIEIRTLPREDAFQIPDLIRTRINLLPEGIKHVRTVDIKGLDLQADGGTHTANTREVGRMSIVDYKSKGKINKRLVIALEPVR